VLLQGYPNLEYIIIDGGSTDGSVDIIRKYAPWLAYWVSEPDRGQVDGITKGWARGTGRIIAYLNSDDTYLPNAIQQAVRALNAQPDAPAVCGGELLIDREGMVMREHVVQSATLQDLLRLDFIPQPAVFLRRAAFERVGGFDFRFQGILDFELWLRIAQLGDIHCIPQLLAATRWHSETKTHTQHLQVAQDLKRLIEQVLAGSLRRQFSAMESQIIRARLNYVLTGIYLDYFPKHTRAAAASALAALGYWPPLAIQLLALVVYRISRRFKESWNRTLNRMGIAGRKQIHWSQWRSPSDL
jgi:glycosyltransferase involved in cell wall biosynthesis